MCIQIYEFKESPPSRFSLEDRTKNLDKKSKFPIYIFGDFSPFLTK